MDTAETLVTYADCLGEIRRLATMRLAACREAIKSKGSNRMTRQAAHFQLAKVRGALEILEELRVADGVFARCARQSRNVKTTL